MNEREYRRHLPHFQNSDHDYHVRFSTNDWLLPPAARDIAVEEVILAHAQLAFIRVATVMPEHVHIALQPLLDENGLTQPLCSILRVIKGRSSRRINLLLNRRGSLWQEESFDHQLRNNESLRRTCEYIADNAVRRGLVEFVEDYRWLWWEGRNWRDRPG